MFVPDLGIATLAGARQIAKVNHVVQNPAVVGQFGEIEIRHIDPEFQSSPWRRLSAAETDGAGSPLSKLSKLSIWRGRGGVANQEKRTGQISGSSRFRDAHANLVFFHFSLLSDLSLFRRPGPMSLMHQPKSSKPC